MEKQLEIDCERMHTAIRGKLEKDTKAEDEIIRITLARSKKDRQSLKVGYKTFFGRDLMDDLSKKLSGNFKDTILALFEDQYEYDAKCLYKSMKGMGTDESALIEIMCTRPNWILKKVNEAFQRLYKQDLESWIKGDTSGHFQKLLISLVQCNRSENTHPNEDEMKLEAHQLYNAGEGRLGTDESFFNKIFASKSPAELYSINKWYSDLSGKSLKTAIEKEFSGSVKNALLTILEGIINPTEYFAKRVKKAVKGLGTNNSLLIRTLVSREEIDIPEMRRVYKEIFKVEMVDDIIDDTSGYYKKVLVAIASKN